MDFNEDKAAQGSETAKEPSFQRAYETVASDIAALIRAKYEIGDKLPAERDFAARFGVSRPTVREAILRLSLAGMVEVRKNSGVYVTSRQELANIAEAGTGPFENLDARITIEPEIAALAAEKMTDSVLAQLADSIAMMRWEHSQGQEADVGDRRFHVTIASATGNATLVSIVDQLWKSQLESRIWNEIHRRMQMRAYWPMWLADHERIFEAMQSRNPDNARRAMLKHIRNIKETLLKESSPTGIKASEDQGSP